MGYSPPCSDSKTTHPLVLLVVVLLGPPICHPYGCCEKLLLGWLIRLWHLCMLPVAGFHVEKLNSALGRLLNATSQNNKLNNIGFVKATFTAHHRRKLRLCFNIRDSSSHTKVHGAACGGLSGPPVLVPRSAPRFIPETVQRYLRVVLGKLVGPVRRRGDAYDKYSLNCEETENTVRLRADRHFPLNIQETGINKRRTGRTVSQLS